MKSSAVLFSSTLEAFGMVLLQHLLEGPGDNVLISPLSAAVALSMAAAGADGLTREAILRTLAHDQADDPQSELIKLVARLRDPGHAVALDLVNSLWADRAFPLSQRYAGSMREAYGAEVRNVDFKDSHTAEIINQWAGAATDGRIPTVVESIDRDALLYLVNAIFFRAYWIEPFNPRLTKTEPFTTASGKQLRVPRMRRADVFPYAEHRGYRAVSLRCRGSRFEMLIVLPDRHLPLAGFQGFAKPDLVSAIRPSLKKRRGLLALPRVRIGYKGNLVEQLAGMGMGPSLRPGADFSGLSAVAGEFWISRVIHNTRLDIDEAGTTAAAVTAVELSLGAELPDDLRSKPFEMIVDRPFLIALRDGATDALLFLGVIGDPGVQG